jgi:hypothetical protein
MFLAASTRLIHSASSQSVIHPPPEIANTLFGRMYRSTRAVGSGKIDTINQDDVQRLAIAEFPPVVYLGDYKPASFIILSRSASASLVSLRS